MFIRTYSELIQIPTFEERYEYLKLDGSVGTPTFGFDRYLNQRFYTSSEWKRVRNNIIARDLGLDLGVVGYDIRDRIIVHHMNPMIVNDLVDFNSAVLNPEYLITTCHQTHNAIHYGDSSLLPSLPVERAPGDTKLW